MSNCMCSIFVIHLHRLPIFTAKHNAVIPGARYVEGMVLRKGPRLTPMIRIVRSASSGTEKQCSLGWRHLKLLELLNG